MSIVSLRFPSADIAVSVLASLRESCDWTTAYRRLRDRSTVCCVSQPPDLEKVAWFPVRAIEPVRIWAVSDDSRGPEYVMFQGFFNGV